MRGDSPRGGEMSRSDRGDGALFALDAERPEGWFPVQNLKINMARPVNGPMASIGPFDGVCRKSHYGIYNAAPERSRPFPTEHFIMGSKHKNNR